jgi:hypothetical protein
LLLHTKIHLIFLFFGRRLVKNPFFLLAGALLFDEKIRQGAAQPVIRARLGDAKPPCIVRNQKPKAVDVLILAYLGVQL